MASPDESRPANVDPARVWVTVVCTDCDNCGSAIALSHADEHVVFDDPCGCGGKHILLRDLQRQARLGRKIEVAP